MKKKIRILVADDRQGDAEEVVQAINRAEGFEAEWCDLSPYEIARRLEAQRYDLLLLDVELHSKAPGLPDDPGFGLAILREEAERWRRAGLTVVLYTVKDIFVPGSADAQEMRECLDRGLAAAHIRKPFIAERHIPILRSVAAGGEKR